MTQIDDLTISPKPPSSKMKPNLPILDDVIAKCVPETLNLKVVIFDDEDYQFAKMIHHRYPEIPFYLQVGNPYLDGEYVESHTERLLTLYETLVDRVMASPDMNNVYVLPQLHTLLWSNKKVFKLRFYCDALYNALCPNNASLFMIKFSIIK